MTEKSDIAELNCPFFKTCSAAGNSPESKPIIYYNKSKDKRYNCALGECAYINELNMQALTTVVILNSQKR